MSLVKAWLDYAGLAILALAICMVVDMVTKVRVEYAYINPNDYPPFEPTFFSGFTLRHPVLAATGLLVQYNLHSHIRDLAAPTVVLVFCLLPLWGGLLFRDIFRDIRANRAKGQENPSG